MAVGSSDCWRAWRQRRRWWMVLHACNHWEGTEDSQLLHRSMLRVGSSFVSPNWYLPRIWRSLWSVSYAYRAAVEYIIFDMQGLDRLLQLVEGKLQRKKICGWVRCLVLDDCFLRNGHYNPCVAPLWTGESGFILEDKDYTSKYKSTLGDAVMRARATPQSLLKGYSVCLGKHVQPPSNVLSIIIRSAGGHVSWIPPSSPTDSSALNVDLSSLRRRSSLLSLLLIFFSFVAEMPLVVMKNSLFLSTWAICGNWVGPCMQVTRGLVSIVEPSKTIFIACEEDMEDALLAAKKGIWTFSSDWFMSCIMRQELDFEAPQFSESLWSLRRIQSPRIGPSYLPKYEYWVFSCS